MARRPIQRWIRLPRAPRRLERMGMGIVVMSAFAACGTAAAAAPPSPSLDPQAAMLAFTQCMRQHGVNVSDSSGQGRVQITVPNTQGHTFQSAQTACQKYLPKLGGSGSATPDPARTAELLKFAQCMRAHGVDVPDPQTSGNGFAFSLGGPGAPKIDPNSAAFKNAQSACQKYLPGKPSGGQGLTTTGGGGGSGPGLSISGSGQ
jgi:hypothetical protein